MNTKRKILPAVCCIALLSACASNQMSSSTPMSFGTAAVSANKTLSADALYKMGRYYQGQNRYDLALNAYKKALATDSRFVEARNGLGVIYSKQGKYQEAIELFQLALQQDPKAAHIYSNLGYAYYLQGRYQDAVSALEQATLLDPNNQRAFNNLGLAYAKAGGGAQSVQAFAQAANVVSASTAAGDDKLSAQHLETAAGVTSSASVNAVASVQQVVEAQSEAKQIETQVLEELVLALPKDRGTVRRAEDERTVQVFDSRVKLVQTSANVTELRSEPQVTVQSNVTLLTLTPDLKMVRVEVSNGNGLTGMAGKVGKFLRNQGVAVARLTNQKPFKVQRTQIQYRDGYEAEARLLKANLPESPEVVQRDDIHGSIGIRLVLGKDIVTHTAYFAGKRDMVQLAPKSNKDKS